jgi:hypothetical protein
MSNGQYPAEEIFTPRFLNGRWVTTFNVIDSAVAGKIDDLFMILACFVFTDGAVIGELRVKDHADFNVNKLTGTVDAYINTELGIIEGRLVFNTRRQNTWNFIRVTKDELAFVMESNIKDGALTPRMVHGTLRRCQGPSASSSFLLALRRLLGFAK